MVKNKKVNLNKKEKTYVTIAIAFAVIAISTCVIISMIQHSKYSNVADNEPINSNFEFLVEEESERLVSVNEQKNQFNIYNDYIKKLDNGDYTIEKPFVVIDPFKVSPQTALVSFKTNKKVSVDVTIKGKHNDDFTVTFEASKTHILPIYGLYGDYDNKVVIKTSDGKTNTITISIHTKGNTPGVEVIENKVANCNGQFYFGTSSLGLATSAYDNYGELRWYLSTGYTKGITMLSNGHMLLSNVAPGQDVTSTSGVIEIDMLGYIYNEYELQGGYHHDGFEMEDGKLLLLTSKPGSINIADHIVLLDPKTGKNVKEWNLREIASKIDPNFIGEYEVTWGWINGVDFDKKNNTIVLSVRNNNSIVGIDFETGNIKWILGEEKYWSPKFKDLFIKGNGIDFIYPAGCHSVHVLADGKISIFNNGYNAYKEDAVLCSSLRNNASYAIVYDIDFNNKTAKVDWKFGGKEYFSYALSSFTYTPDNHKLFNSGWHFTDEAYSDPRNNIFSNIYYDAYYLEFDENNNVIVNLHLNESKFEAIKAPIYNLEYSSVKAKKNKVIKNYEVKLGKFNTANDNDEFDVLSEKDTIEYRTNTSAFIPIDYFNSRISVSYDPTFVDTLQVLFISPSGKGYRYYLKKNKDEKGKDSLLVTNLPKGRYYVYINMDGIRYNTKQYIVIE